MLKKILTTIAFLGVFLVGIIVASILHFGAPIIDLNFVNNSGKEIQ